MKIRNPAALAGMLEEYSIDIWFSTEGTAPSPSSPSFLDGDVLAFGNRVVEHMILGVEAPL